MNMPSIYEPCLCGAFIAKESPRMALSGPSVAIVIYLVSIAQHEVLTLRIVKSEHYARVMVEAQSWISHRTDFFAKWG